MSEIRIQNLKLILETISSALTIVGAIVGAAWGINEYLQRQAAARVEQTLEYRKRYDDGGLMDARTLVGSAWLKVDPQLIEIEKRGQWNLLSSLVLGMTYDSEFRRSVTLIIAFYDELYICARDNICDGPTTLDLFGKDALSYWDDEEIFIASERTRRNYACYGYGVEQIGALWKKYSRNLTDGRFSTSLKRCTPA